MAGKETSMANMKPRFLRAASNKLIKPVFGEDGKLQVFLPGSVSMKFMVSAYAAFGASDRSA